MDMSNLKKPAGIDAVVYAADLVDLFLLFESGEVYTDDKRHVPVVRFDAEEACTCFC